MNAQRLGVFQAACDEEAVTPPGYSAAFAHAEGDNGRHPPVGHRAAWSYSMRTLDGRSQPRSQARRLWTRLCLR